MLYFLQQQVDSLNTTERAYLIAAIMALASGLVFCALYIRRLHVKMLEREKETIKMYVEVTRDLVTSNMQVSRVVNENAAVGTKIVEASERNSLSSEALTKAVTNMHQTVLNFLNVELNKNAARTP